MKKGPVGPFRKKLSLRLKLLKKAFSSCTVETLGTCPVTQVTILHGCLIKVVAFPLSSTAILPLVYRLTCDQYEPAKVLRATPDKSCKVLGTPHEPYSVRRLYGIKPFSLYPGNDFPFLFSMWIRTTPIPQNGTALYELVVCTNREERYRGFISF